MVRLCKIYSVHYHSLKVERVSTKREELPLRGKKNYRCDSNIYICYCPFAICVYPFVYVCLRICLRLSVCLRLCTHLLLSIHGFFSARDDRMFTERFPQGVKKACQNCRNSQNKHDPLFKEDTRRLTRM